MPGETTAMRFKVPVLLFAEPREIAGAPQIEVELEEGATVASLLERLYAAHPRLRKFEGHLAVGVNLEYATLDSKIGPGDEVALLPPVSGGKGGTVRIQKGEFDVGRLTADLARVGAGSIVTFVGVVRGESGGSRVEALTYECYEEMAVRELRKLVEAAIEKWRLVDAAVVHRHGRLLVGDNIVFIGVSSPHREAGFEAASFLIEELKVFAPIWKKEETASGAHWAEVDPDRH